MNTEQRWAARRAFAQEAALAEVVLAFANRDVRPLLIKGTATTRLLGLDPATRPSVDLDLLVAASAHPAAAEVLADLGFEDTLRGARPTEAARVHARVWTRGAPVHVSIDLHHSLAHVPDSETLSAALSRDAHTITLGPASVEVPGDGACALIVVLHAAHHVGMARPLKDLRRAVQCLPDSTWLDAAALAAELGAAGSFAFGLRLVDEGAVLADRIDARGDGTLRDQLRARAWEDGPLGIHRLRTAPTAGAAATVLRDALLPSPAFVRSNHPELGTSRTRLTGYYLRRWLRMPRALIRYARVRASHA
jgi:Uncharacterised nucleotidyltransferase